ncbi:MAG TPA: hypothetical protein VLG67_00825 [Candidatus Saccharimonadales bacterium]|nr:hypothetical protein [Candidatus Saccharimonadales bacterium]
MKAEKVVLSFVAVLIGLIAAGIAFYLYQATKTISTTQSKPITIVATPTPAPLSDKDHLLKIENPKNGGVFDKKLITISGKTVSGASVIVSTEDSDQVVSPASNGDFTLTTTIPDGTSVMKIKAIFPDGTEKDETITVTFSTESF